MTNKEYAITNLRQIAENIAIYASYANRSNDKCGEVDEAVTEAEKAVLCLVDVINRVCND